MRSILSSISILLSATVAMAAGGDVTSFIQVQASRTNPLYGYLVGPGTEKLNKPVLRPFSTDGCSLSPNSVINVDITECCVKHDVAYWLGGTEKQKIESDDKIQRCISEKAGTVAGKVYRAGIDEGGDADGHNTFRWGYGWDTLMPYRELTTAEKAQAEKMYGPNLEKLKQKIALKAYQVNLELFTLDFTNLNRFYDDMIVYYFLQNHLKRNDIVTFGQKIEINNMAFHYVVGLKECGEKRIYFQINHFMIWSNLFKLYSNIHKAPWSELQKYVISVQDPGNCLGQP
jgi:hypothetical protein